MSGFELNTIQLHVATFTEDSDTPLFLVLLRGDDNKIYPNLWQVITGTIEGNETALQTALRELNEETGLEPSKFWTIPHVTTFFNTKKNIVSFSAVFGTLVHNHHVILSKEHKDFVWLPYKDCINRLQLPSHRKGTKIFKEFILSDLSSELFSINI